MAQERITTAEAARRLGVSTRTVRRMVRAGGLRAESERRPQGTRLLILWDAATDAAITGQEAAGHEAEHAAAAASMTAPTDPFHTHLTDQVRRLEARLDAAEREREHLEQLLAMALSRLPAGQAAIENLGGTDAAGQAAVAPSEVAVRRVRRPWWRFWVRDKGKGRPHE